MSANCPSRSLVLEAHASVCDEDHLVEQFYEPPIHKFSALSECDDITIGCITAVPSRLCLPLGWVLFVVPLPNPKMLMIGIVMLSFVLILESMVRVASSL